MDTISGRVSLLRELAGLSARALGILAGLHPTHIGLIERGDRLDPSSSAMDRIAVVLGCTLDWLVGGRGPAFLSAPDLDPERTEDRGAIASHVLAAVAAARLAHQHAAAELIPTARAVGES